MGDLGQDTAVQGSDGSYTAAVSQDWQVWGPQGGYVSSIALRAAGEEMNRLRPVSINVAYLSAAKFENVELKVELTRETKFASAARVTMTQGDHVVLTAQVWGGDDMGGLEHETVNPTVASWQDLPSIADLIPSDEARYPFYNQVEERPVAFIEDWENRSASEPTHDQWYRFTKAETFDDPWLDACRAAVVLDLDSWNATCRAHPHPMQWFAPTIEFTARFVAPASESPWLLSRATAPIARAGLVACTGEVWTHDQRQLVAIGGSTLMSLPSARRPQTDD